MCDKIKLYTGIIKTKDLINNRDYSLKDFSDVSDYDDLESYTDWLLEEFFSCYFEEYGLEYDYEEAPYAAIQEVELKLYPLIKKDPNN